MQILEENVKVNDTLDNASEEHEKKDIIFINEETIQNKIYMIRGQKVMLDFELAKIYGYTTKKFNQQVKNNIDKFDDDFRFQLTKEEFENLRSNFLTSSWGGTRYLPYAFTEEGIFENLNKPCYPKSFIIRVELPQAA